MKKKTMIGGLAALFAITTVVFFACQKDATKSTSSSAVDNAKGGGSAGAYDKPTITCGDETLVSIDILVTAGATGAPSGFSIQWMTLDDYNTYGWPVCDGDLCQNAPSFCKASFSGNANLSRYNLAPNASVTVNIGDLLFDNGASTTCPGELQCGTSYVFRCFAHGDSKKGQSKFGANLTCSTLACDENCTHNGFGYWKQHCDQIAEPGLTLGTNLYSPAQVCCILGNSPNPGNGYLIVAHQLIAALLNGVDPNNPDVLNAQAYIGSAVLTQATNIDGTCNNANIGFKKAGDPETQFPGMIGRLKHANETCE